MSLSNLRTKKREQSEDGVLVLPKIFLNKPYEEEVILKTGQSTVFEVPFKANPQPKVTWAFNSGTMLEDKHIEVETIKNLTCVRLLKVHRSDTGEYTLTLENASGKATMTIKLKVLGKCLLCFRVKVHYS